MAERQLPNLSGTTQLQKNIVSCCTQWLRSIGGEEFDD
jgi:hypothetical protein